MSISASDIKFYKAQNNNDADGNGGRISTTRITTNTLNNLFPNVTNAERTAGITRYRKFFLRNENAADYTLQNTDMWIDARSLAADYFQIILGTDTDVQSAADGYTSWCGAGLLNTSVGSGESTLIVDFDTGSGVFSGENTWVHVDDGSGEVKVKVLGTPSWVGNTATFTISGEIGRAFTSAVTAVSTIVQLDDVATSLNSWTETSPAGTFDESTYPVVLFNVGSVSDNWTLTFSSASAFSVSGAQTGSIGSGDVSTDFQPVNGSSYYMKIDADGWGGSWVSGDTIAFNTVHAGKAVWAREVVPAGAASYASNVVTLGWDGESA